MRNKNAKYGGFYIIDLDKIIIVYYYQIPRCFVFKDFVNYQNNKFICSTIILSNKVQNIINKSFRLILFELINEENGGIKIKKLDSIEGPHYIINNSSLISNYFLITSNENCNSFFKIIDDKFIFCSDYKIEPKKMENDSIKQLIKKNNDFIINK